LEPSHRHGEAGDRHGEAGDRHGEAGDRHGEAGDRPYRGKRAFDLLLTAIVAVPAAVIGGVAALAIRATSPGPVFFRQERIGMGGRPFVVWKFRTMVHGDNPTFPDASRITTVGRILRRLSLDELPQLINVARGEMSIVGPRPTLAYQVERYDDEQRRRLAVRPGLT
jgi:lipopolysaccharide/colanic/teichoic acid biosynthesis glycosyltransferase